MKKLSFIFVILFILVGALSMDASAICRNYPNCRGEDSPPSPLPSIPYSNVSLWCGFDRDSALGFELNANIPTDRSITRSSRLINQSGDIFYSPTIFNWLRADGVLVVQGTYLGWQRGENFTIEVTLSRSGFSPTIIRRGFVVNSCTGYSE